MPNCGSPSSPLRALRAFGAAAGALIACLPGAGCSVPRPAAAVGSSPSPAAAPAPIPAGHFRLTVHQGKNGGKHEGTTRFVLEAPDSEAGDAAVAPPPLGGRTPFLVSALLGGSVSNEIYAGEGGPPRIGREVFLLGPGESGGTASVDLPGGGSAAAIQLQWLFGTGEGDGGKGQGPAAGGRRRPEPTVVLARSGEYPTAEPLALARRGPLTLRLYVGERSVGRYYAEYRKASDKEGVVQGGKPSPHWTAAELGAWEAAHGGAPR